MFHSLSEANQNQVRRGVRDDGISHLHQLKAQSQRREREIEAATEKTKKRTAEMRDSFKHSRTKGVVPRGAISPLNLSEQSGGCGGCMTGGGEQCEEVVLSPMKQLEETVHSMAISAAKRAGAAPFFCDEEEFVRDWWARELGPNRLAWELHVAACAEDDEGCDRSALEDMEGWGILLSPDRPSIQSSPGSETYTDSSEWGADFLHSLSPTMRRSSSWATLSSESDREPCFMLPRLEIPCATHEAKPSPPPQQYTDQEPALRQYLPDLDFVTSAELFHRRVALIGLNNKPLPERGDR